MCHKIITNDLPKGKCYTYMEVLQLLIEKQNEVIDVINKIDMRPTYQYKVNIESATYDLYINFTSKEDITIETLFEHLTKICGNDISYSATGQYDTYNIVGIWACDGEYFEINYNYDGLIEHEKVSTASIRQVYLDKYVV